MDEPRRGIITELLEFNKNEKGPYLVSEGRIRKGQYICVVWLSPDIYRFSSYIMVFKKEPRIIVQVAEWSDKAGFEHISPMLKKLIKYYAPLYIGDIMLGVGRNSFGEQFIDYLRREPENQYYYYTEARRNTVSGVVDDKSGIYCDEKDRIGLIEELKGAVTKAKIYPFSNSQIDALKNIVVDNNKYILPEKDEAFIMALSGAYRMFKDHPYRKPIDEAAQKAFAAEMKRPLFRFGP